MARNSRLKEEPFLSERVFPVSRKRLNDIRLAAWIQALLATGFLAFAWGALRLATPWRALVLGLAALAFLLAAMRSGRLLEGAKRGEQDITLGSEALRIAPGLVFSRSELLNIRQKGFSRKSGGTVALEVRAKTWRAPRKVHIDARVYHGGEEIFPALKTWMSKPDG